MPHTDYGMTQHRWRYLKALRPEPPRMVHISKHAWMQRSASGVMSPMVQRHGETYNVGRNAAKREARKLRRVRK